jgi:peptide/nickel transport system substrate-binding protein
VALPKLPVYNQPMRTKTSRTTPLRLVHSPQSSVLTPSSVLILLLASALVLSPQSSVLSPRAVAQSTSRVINGHAVAGRFLEVWGSQSSEQNSVYVNGLPITDRRAEISLTDGKSYDTQWFERARYEAHSGNRAPYDVLLGLLGVSLTGGRGALDPVTHKVRNPADQPFLGIDPPADVDNKTKVWFQETRHSISGKILEYWNRFGALKQFGFPLSEQFSEISATDGRTYTVQYFERNRFELHPEKAAPYEVELGLLGVQQYMLAPIPSDKLPIAPPAGGSTNRDTLIVAMSQEPATLFPLFDTSSVARFASAPLFNGLVNRDTRDNLYPEVAWYVPTVENGGALFVGSGEDRHLVVKYRLRPGIKWADGIEITSNDAVYYHKLALDPGSPIADRTLFEEVASINNPDKYTVIFDFMSLAQARDFYNRTQDKEHFGYLKEFVDRQRPVTDPLYNTVGGILPQHILAKIPADRIVESPYARNPIGNGPFKLDHWTTGVEIVLAPNPNYNLTAPALLKKIIIKIIGDTGQLITQLKTGDLDAATAEAFPTPSPDLDTLAGSGQKVEYVPARVWEQISFNLDRPYFQDKTVRQAIATAINRQQIVDKVASGKFAVLNTFLTPASWASMQNPDFARDWQTKFPLKQYSYDPLKANQLLDAAGWARGPDGTRARNGVKLSFEYATTGGNLHQLITQQVQADLRQVGIDARINLIPTTYYFAHDGYLAKRQLDFAEFIRTLDTDPSGSDYESANIPTASNSYNGLNYSGYNNPRYDQLSRSASAEIDRSKRAPLFAEMQQIFAEDLPALPLYVRAKIEVHKTSLLNWETSGGDTPATYRAAALFFGP